MINSHQVFIFVLNTCYFLNQKLHILFLCGWYPSRILPTNGDFIQRHAEAVSLQHKVSVLHIISDDSLTQNIEYNSSEINGVTTHIAYVKKVKNSLKKVILFYKAYQKLLTKIGNFDIVHLNKLYPFGIFALHLKWFKKKPFIISEHWSGYLGAQSKSIRNFEKVISKHIVKNAIFICPVSIDLKENMLKIGLTGNYTIIPNVIDTSIFTTAKKENEILQILHVSSMDNGIKNITGILNVISKLQDNIDSFKITFIGENSLKYRTQSQQLGIKNIDFINQISQQKLVKYYQKSDVFVLFSNTETQSCVALESLACGTPVIATNLKSIAEYLTPNFGTLVPVKDEKKLLETLTNFNAKKFATTKEMHQFIDEHYSPEKICYQFSKLYLKTKTFANN